MTNPNDYYELEGAIEHLEHCWNFDHQCPICVDSKRIVFRAAKQHLQQLKGNEGRKLDVEDARLELIGKIAYCSQVNEWKRVEQLLQEYESFLQCARLADAINK